MRKLVRGVLAGALMAGSVVASAAPGAPAAADAATPPEWAPTMVSAGFFSVCASLADGTVWCWGRNDEGQLGTGETSSTERLPVQVDGIDTAVGVSVGDNTACAWLEDATAWCWGSDDDNQLGDGADEKADAASPVQVEGLTDVESVSVGKAHACAVTTSGEVWCWGSETKGELGDGDPASSETATPVLVDTDLVATAVEAGDHESCLIADADTLACWGSGSHGQLGNGATDDASTPVAVPGLTGVTSVSIGGGRACATLAVGGSTCWGLNDNGQLGIGNNTNVSSPTAVVDLPDGVVASVNSGAAVSCWVPSDGSVRCAGGGWSGLTAGGGSNVPYTMIGDGAVSVTVGEFVVCAVMDDFSVSCFAKNETDKWDLRGRPGEWLGGVTRVWLPAAPWGIRVFESGDVVVDGTADVYTEFEGPQFTPTAWQWQTSSDGETDWTDIDGADTAEVDLAGIEEGTYVRVVVTFSNDLGDTEVASPGVELVVAVDIGTPVLEGIAGVGNDLTVTTPELSGPEPITLEYSWFVSDEENGEYTDLYDLDDPIEYDWESAIITVPEQLAGKWLKAEVYASNDITADVEETAPVRIAPLPKLRSVSIEGNGALGADLTAKPKNAVGTPTYKWQSSADQSTWRNETGTGDSLTVTNNITGRYVRVKCTVSNASGSESKTSDSFLVPVPPAKPAVSKDSVTSSSATFTFAAVSGLTYKATARAADKDVPKKDVAVSVKNAKGTVTVSGLAPGQVVSVVVTVSDSLQSRDSDAVTATTKTVAPSSARNVSLSVSSRKLPTVSWKEPTSTGGATVKYAVEILDATGKVVASGSGLSVTSWSGNKALAKGTYTASVVASNSAGSARAAVSRSVAVR